MQSNRRLALLPVSLATLDLIAMCRLPCLALPVRRLAAWLDGRHVVFGKVSDDESMKVVKAVEAVGSQSGKTSKKVVIADSGELEMPPEEEGEKSE